MAEFDTVIKNGLVFDGARNPRSRGDVGIKDGVITAMGRLQESDAKRVIDATGLHVAPGFIDLHTHYDSQLFWDPYCSISGWHGVTSVVIGNCGFSFAPVAPEVRERAMLSMTRNEAVPLASMQEGMPWDWVTIPEFLDSVDRVPKSVNILPYVGLSPLLIWVLGMEDAKAGKMPTDAQHAEMRRLLHEAMDAGACGWSGQRLRNMNLQRDFDGTPMATDVMHDETCLELAEVLAERNEGFVQMNLVTDDPEADLRHLEKVAEVSRRPLIWNAIVAKPGMPEIHRAPIQWLQSCQERGLRIYGQAIMSDAGLTFTLEDWNMWDSSDSWCEATLGTVEEKMVKLADPAMRKALKADPPGTLTDGPADVVILRTMTAGQKQYENLKIRDVCEIEGKDPVDAMLDIALADNLQTVFFVDMYLGPKQYQREVVDYEYGLPGVSDGGAHTKFLTAGRWPTEFLTTRVRDLAWLTLEDAHWRMSAYPAFCAGFRNRGVLRVGAPADVVVYDYDALRILPEEVAHDYPGGEWRRVQRAEGYRYVLVNGEVTIENDRETNVHSGRLLRYGTGRAAPISA